MRQVIMGIGVAVATWSGFNASCLAEDDLELATYPTVLASDELASESQIDRVGYSSDGYCSGNCGPGCATCQSGYCYVRYDSVIVKPFLSRNSAFPAQVADNLWRNIPFEMDLEYSPRIEVGYLAPTSELGWRARYWHFEADSAAGPANDANGLIVDDAIAISVGATVEDIDTITTLSYDLEVNVVDAEATRSFRGGFMGVGLRYANFDQTYHLSDSDEGSLLAELDTWGLGPTVSLEFSKPTRRYPNLSWIAALRGSLLFGEKSLNSVASDYNSVFMDEVSFMTNAEIQLGAQWQRNNWDLRVAVEGQFWGNVGNATNTYNGQDDSPDNNSSFPTEGDIGFVGLDVTLGKCF